MIDYSVYLTGNPMDEMAPEKAYARAQMSESMTFDKFVKHIADHNGVYTRGTVQGVILDMCECLRRCSWAHWVISSFRLIRWGRKA